MLQTIQVLNLDVPLPGLLPLETFRSAENETTSLISDGASSSLG